MEDFETTVNDTEETGGLFDDYEETTEAETETPEDSTEEAENHDGESVKETTPEQMVRIKFNHEEKEVPLSEAIALAQKGMNYDKVLSERDSLKNSKEFQLIDRKAKESNMTREQYLQWLDDFETQRQLEDEKAKVLEQYPDLPDQVVTENAQLKLDKRKAEESKREAEKQRQTEAEQKQKRDDSLSRFVEAYPDIKDYSKDIPPEVWTKFINGEDLLTAYRAHENTVLKQKIAMLEKNQTNKQKAIGNVKGDAPEAERDDFLAGFLS